MLLAAQAVPLRSGRCRCSGSARKHLGSERLGVLFALAYLYAPVQWLALDEFHAVALACPLLYAVWYLDEGRLPAALLFLALAALTKEEVPLVIAGLGVWFAIARGRRVAGAAIAVAGTALSVLFLTVVMPYFRDGDSPAFYDRYDAVGIADRHRQDGVHRSDRPLEAVTQGRTSPISSSSRSQSPAVPGGAAPAARGLPGARSEPPLRNRDADVDRVPLHGPDRTVPRRRRGVRAARLPRLALLVPAAALVGAVALGPLWAGELVPERRSAHDRIAASRRPRSERRGGQQHERSRRPPLGSAAGLQLPVVREADWVAVDL